MRNSEKVTKSTFLSFLNGSTGNNRQSLVQMNIESAKLRQLSIKSFTISNDQSSKDSDFHRDYQNTDHDGILLNLGSQVIPEGE